MDLQKAFIDVANYLSTIITADLIDVIVPGLGKIDDLRIDAELFTDSTSNVLGWAGVSSYRNSATYDYLPASGVMGFNLAYFGNLSLDQWEGVVFQEMLHTLGFGIMWDLQELVTGAAEDLRFDGANAIEAYGNLGDSALDFARSQDPNMAAGVPIESDGSSGDGTYGGHWDEVIFDNEVMTGSIDISDPANTNFLSVVTVAALEDMGYDTVYAAGDTTASLADDLAANNLDSLIHPDSLIT